MNPSSQVNAMLSSAPLQNGQLRLPATRVPTVCVVDPQADDYQGWHALAEAEGAKLQIVATAAEALRLARTTSIDAWVVSTGLPGVAGTTLCAMLKESTKPPAVYLVADEYSPAVERAALVAGATLFACKPLHTSQIRTWLAHLNQRRTAAVN